MFKNTSLSNLPHMPVLENLKTAFQTEFGSDFSKLPNRHNTLFVIIQHGFLTILPMMDMILEMGIPSHHVFMTTKPHTTSDQAYKYFQENFKRYLSFQWTNNESTETKKSHYKILTEKNNAKLFEKFCEYLRYPDTKNSLIENIIICDEGGKFLNQFIDEYHRPDSRARKNLYDYHVVAIEHTKCGTYSAALKNLPFPLILMADSYIKTQIESEFIAKSMFVNLNEHLKQLINSSAVTIAIVGAGNIGKEVLNFLLKNYPGVSIRIYDKQSAPLSENEIQAQGWNNVSRANTEESPFQQSTIILGCTGVDLTEQLFEETLMENKNHHIHLFSCSSGDTEFQTLLQKMPDYKFESLEDIHDYTLTLGHNSKKYITIYNGGFPMNFLVNQPNGIPAPESVPVHEIQITRSMKLAAIVQALKLLEVVPYRSMEKNASLKEYIKLDADYQWVIIQAFYSELKKENPHKKNEVAEKSNGLHQPNISSVLNIPYYITTNHQIKIQNKIHSQSESIKTLVIHGTAGSGKTTLALHYYHKQKIHYPKNLTRIISAETMVQWEFSLREWAEELPGSLSTLLREEKDSVKQKFLIRKHLRMHLMSNEWCVVIDNWDENEVGIENIEEIFSNLHQNNHKINKGILLITTQNQPPYLDDNKSIDLSFGFSPEESQTLMMNIINTDAVPINLGDEQALQSLAKLLDHLPLALVIAASYLRWENKSRDQNESVFTYEKYITMLAEPLSKLDAEYDKLKGKGLIPRELSREEFRRIKTQEAAVDLSLKKAIRPDSNNPNINLWQMLCFCGFLASDGIPQQLLKNYIEQILPDHEKKMHEVLFNMLLMEAKTYSLLQFENGLSKVDALQSIHMHRVIQKVLRDNYWKMLLSTYNRTLSGQNNNNIIFLYMQSIVSLLSNVTQEKEYEKMNALLVHAEEWGKYYLYYKLSNTDPDIHEADSQHTLSMAYYENGDYKKAEEFAQKSLVTKIAYYRTEEHLSIARTQQNLAGILKELGRHQEAKLLLQNALNTKIIHYSTEAHIDVAGTQQNLACVFGELGCYEQELLLTEKSLATKINHYGTQKHVNVAGTQQNLARILRAVGRYEEAVLLAYQALETTIAHYRTEKHIEVSIIQNTLSMILVNLGRYKDAEELSRKALATNIAHYQTEIHIHVAKAQHGLAIILLRLGRYHDAKEFFQKALAIKITYYGTETHINIAGTQQNLGLVFEKLGNYKEAETLYSQALATKVAYYNTDTHINIVTTQQNLASILGRRGAYQEAALLVKKVLLTKITYYCTEINVHVANTQESLGNLSAQLGCYEEAELLIQKSLSTKISHYRTELCVEVAMTQYNLALFFFYFKDKLEAVLLLVNKCEYTCKTQENGKQHIEKIKKLKNQIAYKALSRQKYEIAIQCFEELIYDSPFYQNHYHNIACAYHLLGLKENKVEHFCKSKQYFEKSLKIEIKINTQVEYANFLRERGFYSEAITFLDEALTQTNSSTDGLSFSPGEAPALPSFLAEKIKNEGAIIIKHPQFLAYYLKIQCLLAQQPYQSEVITDCLIDFIKFSEAFKQNHSESYLPIYDWLLENAHEISKNNANEAQLLIDFRTDIHTLFQQSHRYLVEKPNETQLQITVTDNSTSIHDNIALNAAQEKLVELSLVHSECEITNDDRGYSCLIKGNSIFVTQIYRELELISSSNDKEESPCTLS